MPQNSNIPGTCGKSVTNDNLGETLHVASTDKRTDVERFFVITQKLNKADIVIHLSGNI
jgi:hypothetical protein